MPSFPSHPQQRASFARTPTAMTPHVPPIPFDCCVHPTACLAGAHAERQEGLLTRQWMSQKADALSNQPTVHMVPHQLANSRCTTPAPQAVHLESIGSPMSCRPPSAGPKPPAQHTSGCNIAPLRATSCSPELLPEIQNASSDACCARALGCNYIWL